LARSGGVPRSGPPPSFGVGAQRVWWDVAAPTDPADKAAITPTAHTTLTDRITAPQGYR
jgi:hypothetical protein